MSRSKKSRGLAVVLAILLGGFGAHKFYLRDTGAGIFYVILNIVTLRMVGFGAATVLGWIDAFRMLTMNETEFDRKYNWSYMRKNYSDVSRERPSSRRYKTVQQRKREELSKRRPKPKRTNTFINSGIKKFKDFDLDGAQNDFEKAVKISPNNPDLHFNMACVYSLKEDVQRALTHLEKAIAFGLKGKEMIHTHDALAFLRIQPEFDQFVENNYKWSPSPVERKEAPKEDIMQQLEKLRQLKDKGVITELEFIREKQKISRQS